MKITHLLFSGGRKNNQEDDESDDLQDDVHCNGNTCYKNGRTDKGCELSWDEANDACNNAQGNPKLILNEKFVLVYFLIF